MTTTRLAPLRVGAFLLFFAANFGCGTRPLSIFEPNDVDGGQPGAKVVQTNLPRVNRDNPPFRLTSSEGTDLRLTQLAVKGVVVGPLAFTELHFSFKNPESRTIEGRFQVTLPDTTSISRLAMMTGGGWQEGEMVEKTKARTVYEDFLHRRQDPALLEKTAGNEFSARVFPIAAREEKHLILAYSEELLGPQPYRVALAGLKALDRLSVDVVMNGSRPKHLKYERRGTDTTEDLLLDTSASQGNAVLRSGDHAVIRVHPKLDEVPVALGNVMILFDTSASRLKAFDGQLRLLEQLIQQIAKEPDSHLTLAAFDQAPDLMYDGKSRDCTADVVARLRDRAAMGATDLYSAIAFARESLKRHAFQRLIVMSDAITTVHDLGSDPIVPTIRSLRELGLERLDVVLSSGIRDSDRARSWVTALPKPGVTVDGGLQFTDVLRRLTRQASGKLAVEVAGASWFWPSELDGLQSGDEALVYAQLSPNESVALRVGAQSLRLGAPQPADPALIERAWARGKIASLTERHSHDQSNQSLKQDVIALSQRFRVLSPFTSLLVLETDADYRRYNVPRDVNILRIKDSHVVATAGEKSAASPPPTQIQPIVESAAPIDETQRFGLIGVPIQQPQATSSAVTPTPREPWGRDTAQQPDEVDARGNMWGNEIGDAFGAGGLGLSGIGEGGGGTISKWTSPGGSRRDEGIGLGSIGTIGRGATAPKVPQGWSFGSGRGHLGGSHRTLAPTIRTGAATVNGRLPPEVIQRIVRQNYGRFRLCYEQGLARNPGLEGRVAVRFVIGRDGQVGKPTNAGSDLPDRTTVACVVQAFSGLSFPVPEGGTVTVQYPIMFAPGGGTPARARETASIPSPEQYDDSPWDGKYAEVMSEIGKRRFDLATARSEHWRDEDPGNLLAWVALGRAYQAQGAKAKAARALGSIIDLWGFRADLRRFVAGELEALHADYLGLAVDSYRHALADRADHPSSRLWLAIALMKEGEYGEALSVLNAAYDYSYAGRYVESRRIFAELIQLCAAAQIQREPEHAQPIRQRIEALGLSVAKTPTVRFLLTWESDANDVDFHVIDQSGRLANFAAPALPNEGGWLYADVTDGYGPECFQIDNPRQRGARRYSLYAHYYRRGPMGAGLGKLEVVEHDGKGKLTFESRPYVVTRDGTRTALGEVSFVRK